MKAIKQWLVLLVMILAPNVCFAAADDIARLYTFTTGGVIYSTQVNSEFNQIINTMNGKFGRSVNNTLSGTNIFSGTNTFSGATVFSNATAPIKVDKLLENTDLTGLTIDGVLLKDDFINISRDAKTISSVATGTDIVTMSAAHGLTSGDSVQFLTSGTLPTGLSTATTYYVGGGGDFTTTTYKVYTDSGLTTLVDITSSGSGTHTIDADPAVLSDGDIWYNTTSDTFKGRANGSTVTLLTAASLGDWPPEYREGKYLEYVSSTQVKVPANSYYRDDSNTCNISVTSDITNDITTTTGAAVVNALMNGLSEANSQWYYVWLIAKSDCSDPATVLNTSSSTVATYPTDYSLKRLVGLVRNDSSGNLLDFYSVGNSGVIEVYYDYSFPEFGATVAETNILDNGTATTFTAVSAAAFIPPIDGVMGYLNLASGSTNTTSHAIRPTGESHNGWVWKENNNPEYNLWLKAGTTQQYDYKVSSSSYPLDLHIMGYKFNSGEL